MSFNNDQNAFPFLALLCISASSLAFELVLMRLFSIVQWYHFAYMVISIALLGFAASGTLLAVVQTRTRWHASAWQNALIVPLTSFLLFLATTASFSVAQKIPFSPFQLAWHKQQYLYLTGYYVCFFIPFFLAGCFIGLHFMHFREQIGRVYCFNLLGSSVGVAIAMISFFLLPPKLLLLSPSLFALLGFFFSLQRMVRTKPFIVASMIGVILLSAYLMQGGVTLKISQFKGISKALHLPEAQVEYEEYSPLGLVQVVAAPSLRFAPGLSLLYDGSLPRQKELFIDGNTYGAVTNFGGNRDALTHLDYGTFALAYHVISPEDVLVLSSAGGGQILTALYHSAGHIQGIESHPSVVRLMRGPLKSFTQGIYDSHPHVDIKVASPRQFMAKDERSFDLIHLNLIGSWGGVGGGIYAAGENYSYTVEAFREYFDHLKPGGILSASAWLANPPRTFLKLLSLAAETLDEAGPASVSPSLVAIRSWATGTVLMRKGEFSAADIVRIKGFCKERGFDLVYYPGIRKREVNHYSVIDRPVYYESVMRLLQRDTRSGLYEEYLFNIKPPTDDKPYFFHFLRLSALPYLLNAMGKAWIPFLEWGSITLWATLLQALVLAPLFIVLPLVLTRGRERPSPLGNGRIFLYFFLIGLAFMFVEMALIQKTILALIHPITALALVLFALLLFSGIGSLLSSRLTESRRWLPFGVIILFSLFSIIGIDGLFRAFLGYPLFLKCLFVVSLLAPLGVFMGMPFPMGLQKVSDRQSNYIPWVWGVNGVASVIAPVLGSILSVWLGFRVIMIVSLLLYAVAGWIFPLLARD
jgi:SAM-dependent methyltransferase